MTLHKFYSIRLNFLYITCTVHIFMHLLWFVGLSGAIYIYKMHCHISRSMGPYLNPSHNLITSIVIIHVYVLGCEWPSVWLPLMYTNGLL